MLVNADFKQLEVICAFYLSKDKVGYKEVREKVDIHAVNQKTFGLGDGAEGRLIAKKFKFRLIYGGSAPAYANDSDFMDVSTDVKFWQDVIDKYYQKYQGLARWHEQIVERVMADGFLEIPTGRIFKYKPERDWKNEWKWPITKIKNYPVQGLGADLMVIARILIARAVKARPHLSQCLFVCTVHDSIVLDVPNEFVKEIVQIIFQCWQEIPKYFEKYFGLEFDLPTSVEVGVGQNWSSLKEVDERGEYKQ